MTAHGFILFGIVATIFIALFAFRPRRASYLSELQALIANLPEGRLESIAELNEEDFNQQDSFFWTASNRLRGVVERLYALTVLVRVLQLRLIERPDLADRAHEVWRLLAVQAWFSMWAFPEALLCKMWGDLPHASARLAAARHVVATFRTQDICITEDTPECIGSMY